MHPFTMCPGCQSEADSWLTLYIAGRACIQCAQCERIYVTNTVVQLVELGAFVRDNLPQPGNWPTYGVMGDEVDKQVTSARGGA